jgi:Tfp pilus assembly protein PilF
VGPGIRAAAGAAAVVLFLASGHGRPQYRAPAVDIHVPATAAEAVDVGLRHLSGRTKSELEAALAWFERATLLDRSDPRAWAGLADAYALLGSFGYRAPGEVHERARAHAETALTLNPDEALAHRALADVARDRDRDFAAAERGYRRALALDSTDWSTYSRYACLLHRAGRPLEAVAAMRQAEMLAPDVADVAAELGLYLHAARQYDAEMEQLRRAAARHPASAAALFHLGLGLARRTEYAEAASVLDRAVTASDRELRYVAWLARILAEAGRIEDAQSALDEVASRAQRDYVPPALVGAARMALRAQAGTSED